MPASSTEIIRVPAVAGQFYPGDRDELSRAVAGYLANVKDLPEIDGQILALIVPHAGYVYSGQIAAYAYKLLENSPVKNVIICCPSHRYPFEGISVYGPGVRWQTPLGSIACHNRYCQGLIDYDKRIKNLGEVHRLEHSLEVQLPFLQAVLDDFALVPAAMGNPTPETINLLADALSALGVDDSTIMIASTDWQHYKSAAEGWTYDSAGLACLQEMDADKLIKFLSEKKTLMCGGGSVAAVMKAAIARGANRVAVLKYGDSGDITGDKSSVVSYVAAVLYRHEIQEGLSETDKKALLKIARQSIETYLRDGSVPTFDVPESLRKAGAAFVTLEKNDRLRGCIGQTAAITPLVETVSHCAIQAAVSDPRFTPVTADEMTGIHIEISVLTPLQRVKSLEEIKVGRDGLTITMGRNRGLLLPQVATEYGWDRTTFLQQTCRKAGLPPDAYLSDRAEIYRFQAVIFGE